MLTLLVNRAYGYVRNPIRQDLWRAGHAHAAGLIILSLVIFRYVDDAALSSGLKHFVALCAPTAAILMPLAFFLSVLSPDATQPSALINPAFVGALSIASGTLILGIGLIRAKKL